MPAALNKTELLAVFDAELDKLLRTLEPIDDHSASWSSSADPTTIKSLIAHRTHWIELLFGWYDAGKKGAEVHVPAKGYKWNQLKEYNASVYAKGNQTKWTELHSEFCRSSQNLRKFIEELDNSELYGSAVYDWTGKWTLGRYAEASGPSHFRSANKYVRKVLRDHR